MSAIFDIPLTAEYVGAQLGAARRNAGVTQHELAAFMQSAGFKWHQQTVRKVEGGSRNLLFTEAVAVQEFLGADFTGGTR